MTWHTEPDPELENLLEQIRSTRGVNFTGYKRTTLTRRIRKRMEQAGIATYGEYRDLLEADIDEFNALFDTVLINVTSFFRDRAAWDYLGEEVVPTILERKPPGEPIRVWSAGCASGQEPYTIAMILAEALGAAHLGNAVKIFATDVDNNALAQARQGAYSQKEMADVPEHLRQRYFDAVGDQFVFRGGPRRAVIFGRHDLTRDAPISRLDLLVCRNTLMYFNADVQAQIMNLFHFALEEEGCLFLGKAEMLVSHGGLFSAVSMKHRIFKRAAIPTPREAPRTKSITEVGRDLSVRELLVEVAPMAMLAVDENGVLVDANRKARSMFDLAARDIGQPLPNLEVAHRPVELRPRIDQAVAEHSAFYERSIERVLPDGQTQFLELSITPLFNQDGTSSGAAVAFVDMTKSQELLHTELQRSQEELETTYEELRSTNEELETTNEELQSTNEELETTYEELRSTYEELQSANEELETTNEELQSSNEELETVNEELQSSNEELETTNEELQSSNEELEATNDELGIRASEAANLNERLNVLLSSLSAAVIVVDREFLVELWNSTAQELWGLRQDEVVGKAFALLDIGLPVAELIPHLRACLDAGSALESTTLDGRTRTGKPVRLRALCTPVSGTDPVSGVVMVVDVLDDGNGARG